jgi:ABC-type histidine transport system ATPase subunit
VGEVLDTLRMLAQDGRTLIAVTHEIGPARKLISNAQQTRTREFLGRIL